MTAKVTSSASVSLGAIPTRGRQGARWGAAFSRSSMVTYSAVARVSRSASTGPPGSTLGSNADQGHPPLNSAPLGIDRLAGAPQHRGQLLAPWADRKALGITNRRKSETTKCDDRSTLDGGPSDLFLAGV